MLTVDYDTLGVRAGERLLDLGAGGGRHAFEAFRRGAHVVALDYNGVELHDVRSLFAAMLVNADCPEGTTAAVARGDACCLPFPDESFDRIIASEVFEHVPDDRTAYGELARILRPGGTMALTVPSYLPEKVCWALSDEYHAPFVEGGHVRIYTAQQVRERLGEAALAPTGSHRAHALHSPYWWLRCAVGPANETNRLVNAYKQLLTWDIAGTPVVSRITRTAERMLNPILGKSLVVYATKPIGSAVDGAANASDTTAIAAGTIEEPAHV